MKCTKEDLVSKAIELFKQKGFENITVSQICQACHVTKGSFYHHFKTKNEVLLSYYSILLKNPTAMMVDVLGTKSHKEQLWMVLEYSIDATLKLGPDLLYNMIIADMEQGATLFTPNAAALERDTKDYGEISFKLIEMAQKQKEILSERSPEELWFAYISGLIGIAMHWSAGGGIYDEKKALRNLFDIIFA